MKIQVVKNQAQNKTFKYFKKELHICKQSMFRGNNTMEEQQIKNDFMNTVHAYENLDYTDLIHLKKLFKKNDKWRDKAIIMALNSKSYETESLSKSIHNEFIGGRQITNVLDGEGIIYENE